MSERSVKVRGREHLDTLCGLDAGLRPTLLKCLEGSFSKTELGFGFKAGFYKT